MLKEKLYKEYLEKYDAYQHKHREVDSYQQKKLNLDNEFDEREKATQEKCQKELSRLREEQNSLRKKLKELQEGHADPNVIKKYSAEKYQEINLCEQKVQQLEKDRDEQDRTLKAQKQKELQDLEKAKKDCQTRLEELQSSSTGDNGVKNFNEEKFRQNLLDQQKQETEQAQQDYDASIAELQHQLNNMDAEYETKLASELQRFEIDMYAMDTYNHLIDKRDKNELPTILYDALEENIESFVERKGVTTGEEVDRLTNQASSLTHLESFAPGWLNVILKAGFPILAGLILLVVFLFGGINFGFVGVAANWIVTILFWILCAVVGFGVFYGVCAGILHKGTGLSIVAGTVGVIVALALGLDYNISLPSGLINVLELIIKFLISATVGGALYFIFKWDAIEDFVTGIAVKIGFIKKICLKHQGEWLQNNVDGYYALINYKELLPYLLEQERNAKTEDIKSRLAVLITEKEDKLSSIDKRHQADIENKVSAEKSAAETSRKRHEKQQMELFMAQDQCMMELAGFDEKIQAATQNFDAKIQKVKEDFTNKINANKEKIKQLKANANIGIDQLIEECIMRDAGIEQEQQNVRDSYDAEMQGISSARDARKQQLDDEIAALNRSFEPADKELGELFKKITGPDVVGLEESKGQLSDKIYLFNPKGQENPKRFHEICHNKKPIVFLYDLKETTKISTTLFPFMERMIYSFLFINSHKILDLIVIELTAGTSFLQNKRIRVVEKDGVKNLFNEIDALRKEIASSPVANTSLDEFNKYIHDSGEDESKYKKYKLVQFVVPEEEAVQETNVFDANNWNNLVESERYGFLPIFYINYHDWVNTFDEENKLNSKFIKTLKRTLGNDGNIFKITNEDLENMTFKKI